MRAVPHRWGAWPQAGGLVDLQRLGGQRQPVVEQHTLAQRLQRGFGRNAIHLHLVGFELLFLRLGDTGVQHTVVGQQQQTFRIPVQPPGHAQGRVGDELRQRGPVTVGAELGEHVEGFVEEDDFGHGWARF